MAFELKISQSIVINKTLFSSIPTTTANLTLTLNLCGGCDIWQGCGGEGESVAPRKLGGIRSRIQLPGRNDRMREDKWPTTRQLGALIWKLWCISQPPRQLGLLSYPSRRSSSIYPGEIFFQRKIWWAARTAWIFEEKNVCSSRWNRWISSAASR